MPRLLSAVVLPACTLGLASALLLATPVAEGPPADLLRIGPDEAAGSSRAVVVGHAALAHTGQVLPLDEGNRVTGKAEAQTGRVLGHLETALKAAGSGLDRAVRLHFYLARADVLPAVRTALARRFAGKGPAVSFVVGTLAHPDALLAADAVAVSTLSPEAASVKRVRAGLRSGSGASAAVLPAGPVVYVSGQAEKGATLAEATRKTLASLGATLRFLSLGSGHVVQVKSFVHPMAKLDEVRREMTAFFGKGAVPPLVFVEWLAADSIEIELIAAGPAKVKPEQPIDYLTPPGMKASPLFSRVCRINRGRRVYVGGVHGEGKDATAEVKSAFASLGEILAKTGSDFRHLVKATYYVSGDDASRQLNLVRPSFYDPKRPPAASKASVAGTGLEGRGITLDMIAVAAR
jgi:enamine deaminase RidA (YjgF/YER057c/UK114 family)